MRRFCFSGKLVSRKTSNAGKPFPAVKDHVFLPMATALQDADETFRPLLTSARLREIVSLIPEEWLRDEHAFDTVDAHRQAYLDFLQARVAQSHLFIKEAEHARAALV